MVWSRRDNNRVGWGENFFRGWDAFSCTHVLSERLTIKPGREKCDQRTEMRRWTEGWGVSSDLYACISIFVRTLIDTMASFSNPSQLKAQT